MQFECLGIKGTRWARNNIRRKMNSGSACYSVQKVKLPVRKHLGYVWTWRSIIGYVCASSSLQPEKNNLVRGQRSLSSGMYWHVICSSSPMFWSNMLPTSSGAKGTSARLQIITFQKTVFLVTAMRTSNFKYKVGWALESPAENRTLAIQLVAIPTELFWLPNQGVDED